MSAADKEPSKDEKPSKPRTRVPRPDELSQETFEFIAAVDEYKRDRLRNILELEDVLEIVRSLGYLRKGFRGSELHALEAALDDYKRAHGRLFPNWSEVFQVIVGLGYERANRVA